MSTSNNSKTGQSASESGANSDIVEKDENRLKFDNIRLHVFVKERRSSVPLEGIPVIALGETSSQQKILLGTLASNHVGYISFDLSDRNIDDYEHIWVYDKDGNQKIDAKPIIVTSPDDATILLDIDKSEIQPDSPRVSLPSVQNPTISDFLKSPNSFAVNPTARLGSGGCENLIPGNFAEHEFSFRQIVLDIDPPLFVKPLQKIQSDEKKKTSSLRIRYGNVYEYKISWIPFGHSLGRLVYSLPLAPCESINVAVIDWSRADEAQRGEDLNVGEHLIHNQRRDRTIEETVIAGLAEWQRGGSVMGGLAGSYNTGAAAISGAAGAAYTTSSGDRDIRVSTAQRIADNISQASNSIRNLHSTVVIQSSQQEKDIVQTRTVTNHNHCHAMTMLYYEVLRHYRVVTKLQTQQRAILINFPMLEFDTDNILLNRVILEQVLRDKRLLQCFDAVSELQCYRQIFDETPDRPAATNLDFTFVRLRAKFSTGDPGTLGDSRLTLILRDGRQIRCRSTEPTNIADDSYALRKPATGFLPFISNPTFSANREDWFSLQPDNPVRWGDISNIDIGLTARDGSVVGNWRLSGFHLEGSTEGEGSAGTIFDEDVNHLFNWDEPASMVFQARVTIPQAITLSTERKRPEEMLSMEQRCCINRLITHLNSNKVYYNNALRLFGDHNETLALLENYQPPDGDSNGSLIDRIENRPIASVGSYTVFPSEVESLVFDGDGNRKGEIHDTKGNTSKGGTISIDRIISMPTRGLFAESQLSHCNSCEEKDITKFWDWSESPCPERPPEITGVTPGSRAVQQNLTPSNLPNSVVNIVNPQNAPDPTGMASAMNVLAASNIFRDMSGIQQVGSLLNNLVAANASRPSSNAPASQPSGNGRGGSNVTPSGTNPTQASPKPTAQEQHDQLQVNRNAEEHGELTSRQRRDLGRSYLEDTNQPPQGVAEGQSLLDYTVPGSIPVIAQVKTWGCWATVSTMMVSWKDQTGHTIEQVLNRAGSIYLTTYNNDVTGLTGSQKGAFLSSLGFLGEPPMNISVFGMENLLRNHGPIWVTTDEDPSANFSTHARIIKGMVGDRTVDGTSLRIIDPDGGREYSESFRTFTSKFEEVARGDAATSLRVQIVHF